MNLKIAQMHASEEPYADHEEGHRQLVHEPETSHLQGGIVLFNYDHVIALEAMKTNFKTYNTVCPRSTTIRTGGRGISEGEVVQGQKKQVERIRGVLGCISSSTLTKAVDDLVLDYEPWVQKITEADAVLEAASLKDSESRAAVRGGRMTRNSQRAHYERYFSLSEEHRAILHGSKLSCVGMGSVLSDRSGEDLALRRI